LANSRINAAGRNKKQMANGSLLLSEYDLCEQAEQFASEIER
jgi:hypothetical protein